MLLSQCLVAAEHLVATFAQAVGEERLHALGFLVWHRVQMRVELWDKSFAESPHDPRGLDTVLVVPEIGRASCRERVYVLV